EDLLHQVFFEFVEATRLLAPIEQAGAWLLRVARNRIVDRFRRKAVRGRTVGSGIVGEDGEDATTLAELLPAGDSPEGALARELLVEELAAALDDLPEAQRAVFVAHELEGRSFAELAAESGEPVNTLLSRKHYAVRRLRERLRALREEFEE
ncbi:MAG TPA: sigma-70 family RNA polymerase sigma factor, partial [Xanthomonadales bacterium]|nr:sigma-70 family RNA polymerase sigma factor [Xanthomonadales bacterium]